MREITMPINTGISSLDAIEGMGFSRLVAFGVAVGDPWANATDGRKTNIHSAHATAKKNFLFIRIASQLPAEGSSHLQGVENKIHQNIRAERNENANHRRHEHLVAFF